jgi:hypothetical protein
MESASGGELAHLSKSVVLDQNSESGLAAQFLRSAAYSGAEAPLRALAQVADHYTGGKADETVKSGFKSVGVEQPGAAEFGTSRWMVQQVGSAVGMMVPFMALRSGLNYGAGKLAGTEALNAGTRSLTQSALREAAMSGATGLIYGSILTPSKEENVASSRFYADRLKNGLADGASFAVMSFASPYVKQGLKSGTLALTESTLVPSIAKAPLQTALNFPLVSGMISGVPSGLIAAEAGALKSGRLLATPQEVKESIGSMSVVGGAMGTAAWLLERAAASPQNGAEAEAQRRAQAEAQKRALAEAQKREAGTEDSFGRVGRSNLVGRDVSERFARGAAAGDASWQKSEFASPFDGTSISYKMRKGSSSEPARVFSGGLAFNDGYEALFASGPPQAGSEYFMWTRGNAPSGWQPTRSVIDADAHDMAALVTKAAASSETGHAELVLHSFGTLVFQRMLQMRDNPEVAEALKHVSRVYMIGPATHFDGIEKIAGHAGDQIETGSKTFIATLDMLDANADASKALAKLNPLLAPSIYAGLGVWNVQRKALLEFAAKQAVEMQRNDLSQPWEKATEPFRKQALEIFERNAKDPAWQEAILRRCRDSFVLQMKDVDIDYLHKLGVKVDVVQPIHDQIVPWGGARAVLKLLDIKAPENPPAAGTILKNADGSFRSHIVDADHYWPQKHLSELKDMLTKW